MGDTDQKSTPAAVSSHWLELGKDLGETKGELRTVKWAGGIVVVMVITIFTTIGTAMYGEMRMDVREIRKDVEEMRNKLVSVERLLGNNELKTEPQSQLTTTDTER